MALSPALGAVARIVLDGGEPERAVGLYALASCHDFVARSRWFDDVVGQRVSVAVEALPGERFAAAQAQGRARDVESTLRELLDEVDDA